MPAKEQQEAGVEAIMLARRALEIHTLENGPQSHEVAEDMQMLASLLDYFNDVDDDEVPRLYEQSNAIFARLEGSLSPSVSSCEKNLGTTYYNRAIKAHDVNDLDRCVAYLELALPRFRAAARIFRAINQVNRSNEAAQNVVQVEEYLQEIATKRAV